MVAKSTNNIPFLKPSAIHRRRLHRWNIVLVTGCQHYDGYIQLSLQGKTRRWRTEIVRSDYEWWPVLSLVELNDVEELVDRQFWIQLYSHHGRVNISNIAPYHDENQGDF